MRRLVILAVARLIDYLPIPDSGSKTTACLIPSVINALSRQDFRCKKDLELLEETENRMNEKG
jgi:hypothetical protein